MIGAAAVAAVLVYNRLQERATGRAAQRTFGSQHPDVLLEEPSLRREPTLEASAPRRAPRAACDPRVDYVVALQGVAEAALHPRWAALERRFARGAALSDAGDGRLYATLQVVSRSGVIGEDELIAFRSEVESIAAAHGASVSAPPVREALEGAQAMDRACADLDVQVALHVLGPAGAQLENEPFTVSRRADGVTLLLDIPRTPDLAKSYAAMVKAARRLGGRLVDDNGNSLDDRSLAAIGTEVEALRERFAEIGIEPGSPLALRLFS